MKGRNDMNYRNPCLTMHQPWASLLVYGIKRVEGRSWPAPIRGRLWIHAASKAPDESTIKAMEEFYQEIYAVNGITDIKFPEHYPISRLIGCVEVVGCVKREELASWQLVPEGVRLEALTDYCWLCEHPQKLLIPFEMRGYQKVYNLERKIYESAVRGLTPVKSPFPVKFPLPNPRDPFSLKPGSISVHFSDSKSTDVEKSSNLAAAIAGARAAATQFSKKDHNFQTNITSSRSLPSSLGIDDSKSTTLEEVEKHSSAVKQKSLMDFTPSIEQPQNPQQRLKGGSSHSQQTRSDSKPQLGPPSKIFSLAVKGIKP